MSSFEEDCMASDIIKDNFVAELKDLLKKYAATMEASQWYEEYPSQPQGVTIFITSDEFEIDLGEKLTGDSI